MRARTRSRLFVVGLLVLGLVTPGWNLALTTFGKSNPQNSNNNNNNDRQSGERVQARECGTDSDCSAIRGTSCLESLVENDNKMRCLCSDYKQPVNGHCSSTYKAVKVLCGSTDECTTGAQCQNSNMTNFPGRRCWCMKGYDLVTEDMTCNGSPVVFGFSALSLVAGLLIAGSV